MAYKNASQFCEAFFISPIDKYPVGVYNADNQKIPHGGI